MASERKSWWQWWRRPSKKRQEGLEALADVHNLYRDLGLEPSSYQRFDEPPPPPPATTRSDEARNEEFIPPVKNGGAHASVQEVFVRKGTTAQGTDGGDMESAIAPPIVPDRRSVQGGFTATQGTAQARFPMLNRLESDIGREENAYAPVIGLVSYTGGVGKSTLAAALGAAFSRLDRRCVLVGQTPFSPLAYYFGGPEVNPGHGRTTILHYSQAIEGGGKPVDLLIGEAPTDELIENARLRVPQASVVVMDMEASPHVAEDIPFFDMAIIPVRPDINALVVIERIELALDEAESRPRFGTWYILNQFDAARELHVQISEALRKRLGGRLLEISLPLDNSVQEALASGQPPQVYRSYTPFSHAIEEFESWLEGRIQLDANHSSMEDD